MVALAPIVVIISSLKFHLLSVILSLMVDIFLFLSLWFH